MSMRLKTIIATQFLGKMLLFLLDFASSVILEFYFIFFTELIVVHSSLFNYGHMQTMLKCGYSEIR